PRPRLSWSSHSPPAALPAECVPAASPWSRPSAPWPTLTAGNRVLDNVENRSCLMSLFRLGKEGLMFSGFRQFILRGNVLDLAIAVVIGVAFTAVITAFVKDLLTPLIAAIGGQPDFSALTFTINNSKFLYGDFINAIGSFII